jgi:hypothetical protein
VTAGSACPLVGDSEPGGRKVCLTGEVDHELGLADVSCFERETGPSGGAIDPSWVWVTMLDLRLRVGEGDGDTRDRVSMVRSDNDKRGLRL